MLCDFFDKYVLMIALDSSKNAANSKKMLLDSGVKFIDTSVEMRIP